VSEPVTLSGRAKWIAWTSAIFLPLGMAPLAWVTMLGATFCGLDCGTSVTALLGGLIVSFVVLGTVWLWLIVAMIRRRVSNRQLWVALIADLTLLVILAVAGFEFGGFQLLLGYVGLASEDE
jgi:hypothetical protein